VTVNRLPRVQEPLAARFLTVNGLQLYLRSGGEDLVGRTPLLLIHGLSVSGRYMVPTARRLAVHFPVFVPDLPGFGRSAKPDRVFSIDEMADFVADLVEALGFERVALLGNSFGCEIIATLAVRRPERLARAILVAPTADPQGRRALYMLARGAQTLFREPRSLWPILVRDYLRAGPRRTFRTFFYILQDPIEERLPRIRVPTLVVSGAHDPIVPRRWAAEATRLLPHGRLAVIEEGAHAVNYDAPDQLASLVCDFLLSPA
jgi:pimeloyl-ACP methyl ester carboxylesterase